jgi:hypothetical protein
MFHDRAAGANELHKHMYVLRHRLCCRLTSTGLNILTDLIFAILPAFMLR